MIRKLGWLVAVIALALACMPTYAQAGKVAPQHGDSKAPAAPKMGTDSADKLSETELLKLQVAQKDLVIAQLQSQILQLSSRMLSDTASQSQTKMSAERDEISKAHGGATVLFDPTGLPYLGAPPAPAKDEAKKPEEKKK